MRDSPAPFVALESSTDHTSSEARGHGSFQEVGVSRFNAGKAHDGSGIKQVNDFHKSPPRPGLTHLQSRGGTSTVIRKLVLPLSIVY